MRNVSHDLLHRVALFIPIYVQLFDDIRLHGNFDRYSGLVHQKDKGTQRMSWEFLALLLIEIAFIAIIGLLYTIPVVIVVCLSEWIKKKSNKNKEENNNELS